MLSSRFRETVNCKGLAQNEHTKQAQIIRERTGSSIMSIFCNHKNVGFHLAQFPKISQMQKLCSEPDSTEHTAR